MRVLIATDGSKLAMTAMRVAARLLKIEDRNLDVLCIAPPWNRKNESARRDSYEQKIRSEAARILDRASSVMTPQAATLSLVTETGSPAVLIAEKTGDYDLTVLGARGIGFRSEAGLGPVASRVLEHAIGPVLIGRSPRSENGLHVLVAVDGSAASRRAVDALAQLCDLSSAEVCLMYVAETAWTNLAQEGDWSTASEDEQEFSEAGVLEKEFVREGNDIVRKARNVLDVSGAVINCRTEEGNPANEILSEADAGAYDLVVLGATGNRDVKHRMLGSVSSRVAWEAPCSVLIVREPGETG